MSAAKKVVVAATPSSQEVPAAPSLRERQKPGGEGVAARFP